MSNNPKPGFMHEVDQAFHDLTIKQRNAAWAEEERLRTALNDALGQVADLQAENKELRERLEREEWLAVGERDGYPDYNT